MKDIVLTWPKTKPLADYLAELARAAAEGLVINYRVIHLPTWDPPPKDSNVRCYMVHEGHVRGWSEVLYVALRGENEVADSTGGFWPPGKYIVRSPIWHPIEPIPMRGFRGWRWFDEGAARGAV